MKPYIYVLLLFSQSVVSNSFATPWTVARQAPLLTGFPRQEYWSGLPFPSPGDLPDPGIKPTSLWQVDSLPLSHLGKTICIYYLYIWEAYSVCVCVYIYIYTIVCLIAQSCLTLCCPLDCSLPDSSVHGILQTRILEWGAISFSRGSSQHRPQTYVS